MSTPQRRVSEPLNEETRQKLLRLRQFTESLAKAAEFDVPEIERILSGKGRLLENCPSRNVAALMQLRHSEKYLEEVVAAMAEVRKALSD